MVLGIYPYLVMNGNGQEAVKFYEQALDAKVIGVMRMVDNGEQDDKIIAVANFDPSVNHINDVTELPPHTEGEVRRFFEDYKKLEKKTVTVKKFLGRNEAYKIIKEAVAFYKKCFKGHM